MDVRESVYQLVDRVAAGATIDDAAHGLDLEWDAHGNHATDFLCMPGVWQRLDKARLGELVDWFLAHGADGARLLEKTLSDASYAGAGESPIRRHLLGRTPLPDLRPALVGAFRRRRLTLARSLIERGADPAALAAWVEPDLVTPAAIEVRYQASAEPQRVELTLRLIRLQPDYPASVPSFLPIPRSFTRLGERGLLGGELFDPRSSSVDEESLKSEVVDGDTEVRMVLGVRGIAPAGLALVFRGWVGRNLHWYPSTIRLTGSVELRSDEATVDSDRARSWFRDAAIDPYGPPSTVPFIVTAKPKKNCFAVVEHRDGSWRDVHEIGTALDPELLQAPSVGFDADQQSTPFAHFDSKRGTTKTEVTLKSFGGSPASDPAPLRAAFLHGLSRLDGVTAVRWCDDAGAVALLAAEGSEKQAATPTPAKPKRTKAVSVDHPDRGPSRIAALRNKVEGDPLPWSRVGAPAGAIPDTVGDAPIPPTLRAWLASGDTTWPLPKERPLEPHSFGDLLSADHPELGALLAPLGEHLLAGTCIPLLVPSSCADGTILFLLLALRDADGEAPVLGFDPTDEGLVGVFAARFDHYLARMLGVDPSSPTFLSGPLADPYLEALVKRLPARQRARARPRQGVIAIGSLLEPSA